MFHYSTGYPKRSPIKGNDRMTGNKLYGINSPGERTSKKQRWVDKGIQLPTGPRWLGLGAVSTGFHFRKGSLSHRRWHLTSAAPMAERNKAQAFWNLRQSHRKTLSFLKQSLEEPVIYQSDCAFAGSTSVTSWGQIMKHNWAHSFFHVSPSQLEIVALGSWEAMFGKNSRSGIFENQRSHI